MLLILILSCIIPVWADNDNKDTDADNKQVVAQEEGNGGKEENKENDATDYGGLENEENAPQEQVPTSNGNTKAVVTTAKKVDELTEDDLEQFYTYTDVGDGTWQVGLTDAFKAQVDLEKGGTFTVDGYTWTTGWTLPNPAPGGMHKGKAVTSMAHMFEDCNNLKSLDVSSFNTSSVTTFLRMFENCESLTSLDLGSFKTSNVTNMTSMFEGCRGLTSLDLSSFDTSNVTIFQGMFKDCENITVLDLSSFTLKYGVNPAIMFLNCGKTVNGEPAKGYAMNNNLAYYFNRHNGSDIDDARLHFLIKVEYTVTFEVEGGSAVAKETVVGDDKAIKPAEPTKAGYSFQGWYTDKKCTTPFDFNTAVTGNMTLYAKWERDKYEVIYDTDGGSAVAKETVVGDYKATKPADPTREEYSFQGWYTDEAYTTEYDFNDAVTGSLTLYAKWEKTASTDTKSDTKGNGNDNGSNGNDNNSKKASSNSDFPFTGDEAELMIWILLAITGAAATGVTVFYRKLK